MPLNDHEQRILDEIERRLPKTTRRSSSRSGRTDLYTHLARRIRLASIAFVVGLVMIMLFVASVVVAAIGFVVTVISAVLLYRYVGQLGRDQLRLMQDDGSTLVGVARTDRVAVPSTVGAPRHIARERHGAHTPYARRLPPGERAVYNGHPFPGGVRHATAGWCSFLSARGGARNA